MSRADLRIDAAVASDDVPVGSVIDDPHCNRADAAHLARRGRVVEPLERRVIERAFLDDDAIPGFVGQDRIPFPHLPGDPFVDWGCSMRHLSACCRW